MTAKLATYQQGLKRLLFFQNKPVRVSQIWGRSIPPRLSVYRNNTRSNWTDTLDHDFSLTRSQFRPRVWQALVQRFFIAHPPRHWELNTSVAPFPTFLATQRMKPYIQELADYEWQNLQIFIHPARVKKGAGGVNPTAVVRVYEHSMFDWVQEGAPAGRPPKAVPEVLLFYRDSQNTSHVREADPLLLLFLEHFRKPDASVKTLEVKRKKILPQNTIALERVYRQLKAWEILL